MTTLDDMSREAGWYDDRYTAMKAEIKELREALRNNYNAAIEDAAQMIEPKPGPAQRDYTAQRTEDTIRLRLAAAVRTLYRQETADE